MTKIKNSFRSATLASGLAATLLATAIAGCAPDTPDNQGVRIETISAESGLAFLSADTAQGPHSPQSLLLNFDADPFHSSATYSFFRLGQHVSYATDLGHRQVGSMRVSNRTATWQGPLLTLPALQTKPYTASMWIKTLNTRRTATAKLILMQVADGGTVSVPVAEMEITPGAWQKLQGRIPRIESEDKLHVLRLEVETADIDYLLDDVLIEATELVSAFESELKFEALARAVPAAGIVVNGDVEDGIEPWTHQGGKITLSKQETQSGHYSLLISERTQGWHAPMMAVDKLKDNTVYRISIYVRLTEEFPMANVQLTLRQVVDGKPIFIPVANSVATSDGWTQVVGNVEAPDLSKSEQLSIYLESANPTASYYVDNLTVEEQ